MSTSKPRKKTIDLQIKHKLDRECAMRYTLEGDSFGQRTGLAQHNQSKTTTSTTTTTSAASTSTPLMSVPPMIVVKTEAPQTFASKQAQKRTGQAHSGGCGESKARKIHDQSTSAFFESVDEPIGSCIGSNRTYMRGEDTDPATESMVCRDEMEWKRRYMLLEYKFREREDELQKIQDTDRHKNEQLMNKLKAKIQDIASLKLALNATKEASKQLIDNAKVEKNMATESSKCKLLQDQLQAKDKEITLLELSLKTKENSLKIRKGFQQSFEKVQNDNVYLKRDLEEKDEIIVTLRKTLKDAEVLINKGNSKDEDILSLKSENSRVQEEMTKIKDFEQKRFETKCAQLTTKKLEILALKQTLDTTLLELKTTKAKVNATELVLKTAKTQTDVTLLELKTSKAKLDDEIKKSTQLQSCRDHLWRTNDKLTNDLKGKDQEISVLIKTLKVFEVDVQKMKAKLEKEVKERNKRNQELEKVKEDLKFKMREQLGLVEKIGNLK